MSQIEKKSGIKSTAGSLTDSVAMYQKLGYSVVDLFDENQVRILEKFGKDWLYRLLAKWTAGKEAQYPLEKYHIWSKALNVDHGNIFRNMNRRMTPPKEIQDILINPKLKAFLKQIGVKKYTMWENEIGWLCFRFIRPGAGDGYPMSRKEWGEAKNVVSCWVPVVGYSSKETLALIPGSNLKEYNKYLPADTKFCKGEFRLSPEYKDLEIVRPGLKKGQIIIYGPRTLHTEDVTDSDITRLNLEFRFNPA